MTIRQQRLSATAICPVCKQKIDRLEDIQLLQMRYGRRVLNFYIHSTCLLKAMESSQLGEGVTNEDIK